MNKTRRQVSLAAAFLAAATLSGTAMAQAYPAKPITIIVAYPAGGDTDAMARLYAEKLSTRLGQPVLVDTGLVPHAVRAKTLQSQVSFIHVFSSIPVADTVTLNGEVGYNRVLSNDKAESFNVFLPDGMGGFFPLATQNSDQLYYDKSAWGYTLSASFAYLNVFDGWDLSVPLVFSQAVNGDSSLLGSFGMGEGDDRLGLGTTWTYLNNLTLEARYNAFLGSAKDTPLADRDNFAINVKYSF